MLAQFFHVSPLDRKVPAHATSTHRLGQKNDKDEGRYLRLPDACLIQSVRFFVLEYPSLLQVDTEKCLKVQETPL